MGLRAAPFGMVGVYLVAACVLTWPLVFQLTARLGAPEGPGDPYLNLWILGWGMQAWVTDPMAVLSGRVFDANIFHPVQGALAFSDHLLLQSLVLAPVYAVTGSAVLCYNVLLIVSIAASGMAMHLLARSVTGSTSAAFLAGLAWACWPYRTGHLVHLQLQSLYFLPLVLWALFRLAAARHRSDGLWLGGFAALQTISSVYYGVMTAIAVGVTAIAVAVTSGQWRARRFWSLVVLAAVAGAILIAPVTWVYLQTERREGFTRNLYNAAANAAVVQSYLQVPPDNLVYGRTGALAPRAPAQGERDRRHAEHQMFPGFILIGLAIAGAWRGWRTDARPLVASGVALIVAGLALSFGPDGVRWLYAWLSDTMIGFGSVRAPARFAVIAVAGLCVLAAIGMARLPAGSRVGAVLIALLSLEYVNAPLTFAAPPASTEADTWLAQADGGGAVLYLPLDIDRGNSTFMVRSLRHRRPIVNGYSGQRPSFFPSLVDAFSAPDSSDARATLKDLNVRFIVSASPLSGAGEPSSPLVERARFDDERVYEVVWTPASEAALEADVVAEPPDPGPLPFKQGETATYDVTWLTGPLDVSAGTVTLRVVEPMAGEAGLDGEKPAWAFEATAETARWVSRFFEARDRFRTSANGQLKPLLHVRNLREGRRVVDRAYAYDHEARRVRSGAGADAARDPGALTLPMAPGARDALTALWYVRAMALAPGTSLTLPLNEAGRGLTLKLDVTARETIEIDGRAVAAMRVEPQMIARVQRRQPIQATVWLSDDDRRLPLVVDVSAGFGRVRMKLVDYRP